MSWTILLGLAVALTAILSYLLARRQEVAQIQHRLEDREAAIRRGSHHARLQYPSIDLSQCIGCGSCVRACPEEGVLDLIHGQALVIHGARCVGHGRCAAECPVGAIALTLGDLSKRKDIPVLDAANEVQGRRNLFLAGEVTGFALIRTAIEHGKMVAAEVARRKREHELPPPPTQGHELIIVGAGPAGIACALEAKRLGLDFLVLDQDTLGGTVAKYPRRKLVMTQPVELPLAGRLKKLSYSKEELLETWERIVREQELPMQHGVRFQQVVATEQGYRVESSHGPFMAAAVCLALGRRGTPRRLGVSGEDLPKVSYSLIDAQSFTHRRLLVVGGGDSAVEAAMGLAEQAGNEVVLSYRGAAFSRIKARNEKRLARCLQEGRLRVLMNSNVTLIREDEVELTVEEDGQIRSECLGNDEVFIMIGGEPPFPLLEQAGVRFDHEAPDATQVTLARGVGLLPALTVALAITVAALAWYLWHADYYRLAVVDRPVHESHPWLRPSAGFGLLAGVSAAALILLNLSYLARRSPWLGFFRFGSLQAWMTSHVGTGILALVAALLHSAFSPQDTVGGHAFLGLLFLILTGAIGRYFYSFVPHAANGRELDLEEVRAELSQLSASWDRENRAFGHEVQREIDELIKRGRWHAFLPLRMLALIGQQWALRRTLRSLRRRGREEGIPHRQLRRLLALARRAHWNALLATHFEEIRGLMASWRYFHRWVALLMVLLVTVHILTALRYATLPGWLS